jgi:hypothetical protein
MSYRTAALTWVLALVFAVPGLSVAGDLEDVKAVWEQTLKAYNAMDVEGVFANGHKDAVGFGPGAPFATESQAVSRPGLTAFFAASESINVTPINLGRPDTGQLRPLARDLREARGEVGRGGEPQLLDALGRLGRSAESKSQSVWAAAEPC